MPRRRVVAICSNDADAFPEDSFDAIAKRGRKEQHSRTFATRFDALLAGRQPALAETPPQGYFLTCRAKARFRSSTFAISGAPFELK